MVARKGVTVLIGQAIEEGNLLLGGEGEKRRFALSIG